jgi:g-D-glutamyl-meso-diaminopimelate peptidase
MNIKITAKVKRRTIRVSGGNTDNWQANARGVDINHNFNAGWHELHKLEQKSNINGPGPTRYGGEYPESEIETKAITSLCRNTYFRHAIAFHSQGEEIYWQYGDDMSEKSELIAKVLSVSSGYKMAQPEGLAIGGGFKDWFIKEIKRPGLTIEIGKGKNPLPPSDTTPIYLELRKALFEFPTLF